MIRLFCERVFGVPVEARPLRVKGDQVRLECSFQGVTWKEWRPLDTPAWRGRDLTELTLGQLIGR